MQGSRMNPPLNDNGREQALRLGKALAGATAPPSFMWHSCLERARETAKIAAAQQQPTAIPTDTLSSIREIDFGPSTDGTSVQQAQGQMAATYAQWAVGKLNVRMASDGESGREVRTPPLRLDVAVTQEKPQGRHISHHSISFFLAYRKRCWNAWNRPWMSSWN